MDYVSVVAKDRIYRTAGGCCCPKYPQEDYVPEQLVGHNITYQEWANFIGPINRNGKQFHIKLIIFALILACVPLIAYQYRWYWYVTIIPVTIIWLFVLFKSLKNLKEVNDKHIDDINRDTFQPKGMKFVCHIDKHKHSYVAVVLVSLS